MSWHPPCHPMAPKAWAKGAGTPAFLSRFQVPDLTAFHSTWSSPLEGSAMTFLVWISFSTCTCDSLSGSAGPRLDAPAQIT